MPHGLLCVQASELLEVSDDGQRLRRIVEFDESLVVRKGRPGGGNGGGGGGGNRDATIFIGNLDRSVRAQQGHVPPDAHFTSPRPCAR